MPTLIHIVGGNRWNGITRYALDICSHFHSRGWEVMALTRDAKAVDSLFEKEGIKLFHAPLRGFSDYTSIKTLAGKLKETEGHVVVHAHGFRNVFTALAARRLSGKRDVKVVMTRHKVRRAVDSWILKIIYRNLDALIFVSRAARDRFVSTWHNRLMPITPEKMHVIHNSLNIPPLPYTPPSAGRPVTAMFHGPIKAAKGLEILIDAFALLKGTRIRLRIVGSGTPDYLDRLRRRAVAKGVVEMIDWHKHTDDPLPLIAEADFGVLPSVAEEAFGLSNIEYMAMGRPQIASSNGAQPEYITDGWEGILIPPSNPGFLAENIKRLALDPDLRLRMGENACKSYSQRLSWPHFIDPLTRIYLGSDRENSQISDPPLEAGGKR
ncbi:MAG: glycosyltransferase family 4 protein [Muribaculaceae bacterium]|nr:glycosyltransferase family 4 protein [Muribaculaceae bacterium]